MYNLPSWRLIANMTATSNPSGMEDIFFKKNENTDEY